MSTHTYREWSKGLDTFYSMVVASTYSMKIYTSFLLNRAIDLFIMLRPNEYKTL